MARRTHDPDVPRLPRGRGFSFTGPQVVRILMFAFLLIAVLFMRRPCGDAVGRFVGSFDEQAPGDASVRAIPHPDQLTPGTTQYVEIKPGMSDAEIKAAIDKARSLPPASPSPPPSDAGPR